MACTVYSIDRSLPSELIKPLASLNLITFLLFFFLCDKVNHTCSVARLESGLKFTQFQCLAAEPSQPHQTQAGIFVILQHSVGEEKINRKR